MLKIEGHLLTVTNAEGAHVQIDLPILAVDSVVKVWAVPVDYRESGVWHSVQVAGEPEVVPGCDLSAAKVLGEIEYPQTVSAVLDIARAAAHASIEAWRDTQENAQITFEHAGKVWDGGLATRARLQPVVSMEALPAEFFWTDHSNNDVPMTLEQLKELSVAHESAIVYRGFEIHAAQRLLKQSLLNLTVDELRAFKPADALQAMQASAQEPVTAE